MITGLADVSFVCEFIKLVLGVAVVRLRLVLAGILISSELYFLFYSVFSFDSVNQDVDRKASVTIGSTLMS